MAVRRAEIGVLWQAGRRFPTRASAPVPGKRGRPAQRLLWSWARAGAGAGGVGMGPWPGRVRPFPGAAAAENRNRPPAHARAAPARLGPTAPPAPRAPPSAARGRSQVVR